MINPLVFPDTEAMSRHAAFCLLESLRQTREALFCLATGATPARAYGLFADQFKVDPGLFDRM
jgi:6-phosphogluconolactonase/glucosamine-6-phosphate isomerase/deaminase